MKFHSTKILILIVIFNLAAIAGYYSLFQFIKKQTKAAALLTNTIDLGQQKNSRLNSLRSVVKDTEGKRQKISNLFLSSDMEVPFIEKVETLAKNSGLVFKTNNVSSVATGGNLKSFQIQLEASGRWSDLLYFLSQVENLPYDMHVQGVSLSKQPAAGKVVGQSWSAVFDISVTENK